MLSFSLFESSRPLHLTVSLKCMTATRAANITKSLYTNFPSLRISNKESNQDKQKVENNQKTRNWKLGIWNYTRNKKTNPVWKKINSRENYRFLSSGTVGTTFQQQRNHPIALMLCMFVVSRGLETGNRSVFFLRWVIRKKKKLYYIKKCWLIFQAGGERDES
jgi:hypothetical protein